MGGGVFPPVVVVLGFAHTVGASDRVYFEFGVDRIEFDRVLRQELAWLRSPSPDGPFGSVERRKAAEAAYFATFEPQRLRQLYAAYRTEEARVARADAMHFFWWLVTLVLPPVALLLAAFGLRVRAS